MIDYGEIMAAANGKCYLCGGVLGDYIEIDHIIPISRGGPHERDNLAAVHRSCNRSKSNKLPGEITWLGFRSWEWEYEQ